MRRSLLFALALVPFVVSAVAAAPQVVQYRPTDTLQQLKNAFARGDKGGEWQTLSPGFKARLSRRAGRNVDVGDYISARNAYRNDPRIKELEQWIHTASMTHYHKFGDGRIRARLRFGAPLVLNKNIEVTMINHGMWRLNVRGDEPYWGFVGDPRVTAVAARDGSYTVTTRDERGKVLFQQRIPAANVISYVRFNKWFFDGFGAMEAEFMRGVGAATRPQPQPQPRAPAPRAR